MCNIIINTFYISDKILSNTYIYDIIRKIQLTANRCGNSCNNISKKEFIFKKPFVHLKFVLITQYMMHQNYV